MPPSHPKLNLETLPTELKILILNTLPAVSSLEALTRAIPSYNSIYHSASQAKLLAQVSENEVGDAVLKEAWILLQATRLVQGRDESWKEEIKKQVEYNDVFRGKKIQSGTYDREWNFTLDNLIWISKMLPALHEISLAFCKDTIGCHPVSGEKIEDYKAPSASELRRVKCAFLRFETFLALFFQRDRHSPDNDDRWSGYDPLESEEAGWWVSFQKEWEMEEVKCVQDWYYMEYDSLYKNNLQELKQFHILGVRHKDLQKIDEMSDGECNSHFWERLTESLIYLGFEFVAKIKRASTKEEKLNLVTDVISKTSAVRPSGRYSFLVMTSYIWNVTGDRMVGHGDLGDLLKHSYKSEEDGCNAAWCWELRQWESELFSWWLRQYLRSWGYVMWDRWRLEDLEILSYEVAKLGEHGPKKFRGKLLSDCY